MYLTLNLVRPPLNEQLSAAAVISLACSVILTALVKGSAMPTRRAIPTLLLLYHVLPIAVLIQAQQTDLTFAESMYIKLSGACRAVVDFRYISEPAQDASLVKTMKIVFLNGSTIETFSIDEAYVALTQMTLFDISKPTKIIIHGFKDTSQSSVSMDIAEAYNEKGKFNVMLVDAEELMNKWYILSVHNTRLVGKRLANLLANLENFGASADDFHLVGISLGAHTAGWAGKYYMKFKRHRLGRITGLDPAGPCFSHAYSEQRLDKTDAGYVDVLHSNRLVQGVIEPLGHADYYLNGGGPNQPGCLLPSCSHLRAANVYAESIKYPKAFLAVRCKSWKHFQDNSCENSDYAVLGYGTSTNNRGLYYLRTSANTPFGLGVDGTHYTKATTDNMDTWFKIMNMA